MPPPSTALNCLKKAVRERACVNLLYHGPGAPLPSTPACKTSSLLSPPRKNNRKQVCINGFIVTPSCAKKQALSTHQQLPPTPPPEEDQPNKVLLEQPGTPVRFSRPIRLEARQEAMVMGPLQQLENTLLRMSLEMKKRESGEGEKVSIPLEQRRYEREIRNGVAGYEGGNRCHWLVQRDIGTRYLYEARNEIG